jgi:hypothetical protein
MRLVALRLPSTQVIVHYLAVFLAAFGTTMVSSTTGAFNVSSLEALLISASAAGVVAVAHIVLGLVPTTSSTGLNALGVSLKVKTAAYQVLVSVLATFLSIFGAALVAGATHLTSLPGVIDLVLAAISAGVAGVVTYVTGLIPAPKPAAS